MAKRRRPDRYTRDAALETTVRYSGQESALAALLTQELEQRNLTVKSSEGAAKAATATVKGTREPIRKAYNEAGLTRQEANSDVDNALSGLGAVADIYRGAIARERGQAKTRIGESQASALGEVERRVGQIALGSQAARTAADSRFGQSRREIGQALANLAGEKGAFAALTISKAKETQRDRNVTKRGQDVTAANNAADNARQARKDQADITGIDPLTGKPTAAERDRRRRAAKKNGKPKLTTDQKQKRYDAVGEAQSWIKKFKGQPRSTVTGYLLRGETLTDANGNKLKVPKIGRDWVSVAADLEYDGHVSRRNREVLRRAGISASRAGWNTKPKPRPRSVGSYVGSRVR